MLEKSLSVPGFRDQGERTAQVVGSSLSLDGTELMSDVASGASLASLDPVQYPALKLRANLASTTAGHSPALDNWQLTWQVETIYLPVVIK